MDGAPRSGCFDKGTEAVFILHLAVLYRACNGLTTQVSSWGFIMGKVLTDNLSMTWLDRTASAAAAAARAAAAAPDSLSSAARSLALRTAACRQGPQGFRAVNCMKSGYDAAAVHCAVLRSAFNAKAAGQVGFRASLADVQVAHELTNAVAQILFENRVNLTVSVTYTPPVHGCAPPAAAGCPAATPPVVPTRVLTSSSATADVTVNTDYLLQPAAM
jgi:hypothetical protein